MSTSTDVSLAGTEPDPRERAQHRATRAARRAAAHRREKRRRRRRRVLFGVAGGLLVVAGWLSYRAYQIKTSLDAARAVLVAARTQLLDGGVGAGGLVAQAQADSHGALAAASDPLWSIVAHVPVVGTSFRNATALAQVSDDLSRGSLPVLIDAASDLSRVRSATGTHLPVGALRDLASPLSSVQADLDADVYALGHLPTSGDLAPLDTARRQLLSALRSLNGDVSTAAAAARIGPAMLGADGPRRYFVAFENPAEARPDGGNIGAFAEIVADHGHLRVARMGPNGDLPRLSSPPSSLDPAFRAYYGALGAGSSWVSTNLSPNFTDDADAWAAMYQKATRRAIDGVIAFDPTALGDLAKVTGGGIIVRGYGSVPADHVASFIESGEYAAHLSRAQRQGALAAAGRQVLDRLLDTKLPARALLAVLGRDAGEGHLHLASTRQAEESEIAAFPVSGTIAPTTRPYAGVYVTNAAGTKLDYYLHEQVDYRAPACRASGPGTITVRLRNDAPVHGLPAYVTRRSDHLRPEPPLGDNRDAVTILGTQGGRWMSGRLDGRAIFLPRASGTAATGGPVAAVAGEVAGHPALTVYLEMPLRTTRTLQVRMWQPPSSASAVVTHQAMAQPVSAGASGGC